MTPDEELYSVFVEDLRGALVQAFRLWVDANDANTANQPNIIIHGVITFTATAVASVVRACRLPMSDGEEIIQRVSDYLPEAYHQMWQHLEEGTHERHQA